MCTYFFRAAELPIDPYWGAVILAIYRLVLSFLALFFVKKLPRRLTYITCIGLASIATFMMGTFFFLQSQDDTTFFDNMYIKFMPVIALMVFYFCLSFALLNIPGSFEDIGVFLNTYIFYFISVVLMSEILPLRARSFGCGLVGLLDNLSCMLSAKMVPTIELYMGLHGMFYMYSCVSIFVAIVCFFIIPETKDLTLEEIECMYTSSNQKKSSQEL